MIHVMNAAMMPTEGAYKLKRITGRTFLLAVETAYYEGYLKSWLGYQQNADYIERKTGLRLPLTRKETKIKDGDRLLIMKLRYRVNGAPKGAPVDENDFEFFECEFSATTETSQ
jgi:hypothetical protein